MLAIGILVAEWLGLYFINATQIQTGQIFQVNRNTILSKTIVDYSGIVAALIVIGGVVYRARKKSIPLLVQEIYHSLTNSRKTVSTAQNDKQDAKPGNNSGRRIFFSVVFKDVLLLGRMGECEDFQQWLSHFMIMWGFIGLAVTTTLDAIVNFAAAPQPIISPVRLLGNITGIVFAAGLTLSISRRYFNVDVRTRSRRGDWAFLLSLYGTALSGFMVETFSDTANITGTWIIYPIHLSFIAFVLISAPWTKFVHALWRPSWIVEAKLNPPTNR